MGNAQNTPDPEFESEYTHIRSDIKKTLLVNLAAIALLVAVYLLDRKYGFITSIAEKL